ncbi:hypothetical protein CDAR_271751 [Caerostris darwini]|uniref:Uncharacterized protein n=1 Tax=Caerostris darwini TaxID=1538125 RepID=A0AAV4T218_9ARAC|nr:hypothetical protein CDAR_271751 [Caerostris darwini]
MYKQQTTVAFPGVYLIICYFNFKIPLLLSPGEKLAGGIKSLENGSSSASELWVQCRKSRKNGEKLANGIKHLEIDLQVLQSYGSNTECPDKNVLEKEVFDVLSNCPQIKNIESCRFVIAPSLLNKSLFGTGKSRFLTSQWLRTDDLGLLEAASKRSICAAGRLLSY